jgi:hypothetical protein
MSFWGVVHVGRKEQLARIIQEFPHKWLARYKAAEVTNPGL